MKLLLTVAYIFVPILLIAQPGDVRKIFLETDVQLRIEEIKFSRVLPTSYYDQAIASIPSLYPDHVFIAKRRFGHFAGDIRSPYSLVSYKESSKDKKIIISGVLQNIESKQAWHFQATVDEDQFSDNLILILENVSKLPVSYSLQRSPTASLDVARSAAKAFCAKFGFPPEKISVLNDAPLEGPVSLKRDGRDVVSYRWLGGGRGDYIVQVEIYDKKRILVYGGYNHKEFGPWNYDQ